MGNQQAETLFRLDKKVKVFCTAGREPPPALSCKTGYGRQENLGNGEAYTNVLSWKHTWKCFPVLAKKSCFSVLLSSELWDIIEEVLFKIPRDSGKWIDTPEMGFSEHPEKTAAHIFWLKKCESNAFPRVSVAESDWHGLEQFGIAWVCNWSTFTHCGLTTG